MYNIYEIVWGVQINEEMAEAFSARYDHLDEGDEGWDTAPATFDKDDGGWFVTSYSGDASHEVGYIGEPVYSYDFKCDADKMLKKMNGFSQEKKDAIRKQIDEELPQWLKDVMPEIGWQTVVSTS